MSKKDTIIMLSVLFGLFIVIVIAGGFLFTQLFRGAGEIQQEERRTEEFTEITLKTIGSLYIEQGDAVSVEVEAGENIIDDILTEVEDNELVIRSKEGAKFHSFILNKSPKYYVTVKDLTEVTLSGSGSIKSDGITSDSFKVTLSGSGNIDLELEAKELTATISGSGSIDLSGEVQKQDVTVSGSGGYQARSLDSEECMASIPGSGSITLTVSDKLDAEITGSGDISYYGNPEVTEKISGSGNIRKR